MTLKLKDFKIPLPEDAEDMYGAVVVYRVGNQLIGITILKDYADKTVVMDLMIESITKRQAS